VAAMPSHELSFRLADIDHGRLGIEASPDADSFWNFDRELALPARSCSSGLEYNLRVNGHSADGSAMAETAPFKSNC
jgi:hypothetical protein